MSQPDPRTPVFDAVRATCPPGLFNDPGNIVALHNLLDAFGAPRIPGSKQHALGDAGAFYQGLRKVTGPLNREQVVTVNSLLSEATHWSIGWLAYGFATAWHEARLIPCHEKGGNAYLAKYDTGTLAKALGNTPEADGDGIRYAGRGLVQLTGLTNYKTFSKKLGIDLVGNPDLALQPEIAIKILVLGMEQGLFTGKKLSDYIGEMGTTAVFTSARRIINGVDKAVLIAGYADLIQDALLAGKWA